ncbi:MAG TPA: alpha-ketoglutarate-dependent dioxygenase AlkB [Candidatus Tectomicrobia bacterium]|nr:alpha-ketoglutarate-dependent dioxygenase AlkB [Candidatus Tectomicrobia bacterium]
MRNDTLSNRDLCDDSAQTPHRRGFERLEMPEADVVLYRTCFTGLQSDAFFEELQRNASWNQEKIKLYGKLIDLPRLTAWYGDEGRSYTYSGITVTPIPWMLVLLEIKKEIEVLSGVIFNSVLLNLYRDERDSVSWHSDDEPELGRDPVIGSVSFGATRSFQFKHKQNRTLRQKIELPHGSFLLMRGPTQHCWLHQVPKETKVRGPRINLTFRVIK